MKCFIRFVMFLIYVDIVFVLLVFMIPAEMVYRWTGGYVSCLSDFLGYPDDYRYTLSDFFRDIKQGWRNFK